VFARAEVGPRLGRAMPDEERNCENLAGAGGAVPGATPRLRAATAFAVVVLAFALGLLDEHGPFGVQRVIATRRGRVGLRPA
jgi:hypothetical protein